MSRNLLLLLPVVLAVLIYMEGQEYDPALIDFASSADSSPGAVLPDSIAGYVRAGPIRVFTADNLYEYVDGHAEYYISAGLVGLCVAEYVGTGSGRDSPEVVVEMFELGSGMQAFGVLSDEAGDRPLESSAGALSLRSSRGLSFIAGRYYVKVNAFRDGAPVLEFARRITGEAGEEADLEDVFSKFPDLGPPVATRFIREAYRGLDFLNNVIERRYSLDGDPVHVFLVSGDEETIVALTDAFLVFFDQSGIDWRGLEEDNRTYYRVMDPYEGDWYLVPGAEDLFGIYGARGAEVAARLLDSLKGTAPERGE